MRSRLALCLFAVALTACTSTLEAIAPRAFYGRLVRVDDAHLCLADPRTEDLAAQRCFERGQAELPADAVEGEILAVRYDLGEDGETETLTRVQRVLDR
jgi:hypothetical protein